MCLLHHCPPQKKVVSLWASRILHSAIGSRPILSSLVRAILWLVLFGSCITDPALRVHNWTIVGTSTLALAGLLDEVITAKGNTLWILESPIRWPVWGFGLCLPFSFASFVSLALSFLLPLRLADGVPPWALLVLAFLGFPFCLLGDDSFIDFSHPEQTVVLDLVESFFEIHATMHQLMNLSPCIALCSSSFSQPSTEIFLRVLIGRSPSSGRALMMYLEWMKPISPLLQNLYWRRRRASLPWSRYCGFGMPHLAANSFSSWGRSHRTSLKESGLEGPGPGVAKTDGCVWIISLAALTTWNSFIAAKPELAAVNPLWLASKPSSLGPCCRATWAESQRSARSSTVT